MDNIVSLPTDCSCCILRENILDAMAESGLPLSEILFVLETVKSDAAALCSTNDDGDVA